MKKIIIGLFMLAGTISLKAQTAEEGMRALDFERYEYARNLFKSLTNADPANGDNYYYLGQAYTYLLRPDSARMAYNEGISKAPTNYMNYAGLGELLLSENKVPEAQAQFEKALSFSRDKAGKYKDVNALRLVADAMVSTETKLTAEALQLITLALELDKKNYNVLVTAGDVYLEMNNGGEAANNYERAIALDKGRPKAYNKVGIIWLRVKNGEAAFTDINRALAVDPNYAPALKSLAEYYYLTRKYEKAKETYKKYLQNSEESTANKIRFAQILFKSKEYEEALIKLEEILKVDQSNVYLYRLSGYSYYEVGEAKKDTTKYRPGLAAMQTFFAKVDPSSIIPSDYEYLAKLQSKIPGMDSLAIQTMKKALEVDSTKVEFHRELGMLYNKNRKYTEAVESFETYIAKARRPSAADYYLLGKAAYYGKTFGKADTAFAKVSEIKPDYAEAYLWKGHANAQSDPEGKLTTAKEAYEKYISMAEATPDKNKKNLIDSYLYLAVYNIKHDDNAKAKEYLNKALALEPENKSAKEILKQMK